jgi:hypothetical protein
VLVLLADQGFLLSGEGRLALVAAAPAIHGIARFPAIEARPEPPVLVGDILLSRAARDGRVRLSLMRS